MRNDQKILTINRASVAWSRMSRLQARLEKAAEVTLAYLPKALQFPVSVTLLLTTDAAIRRLNRDFRGLDKPTNVLSFPQYEPNHLRQFKTSTAPVELGDIAIAYQYMVAEAKSDNKILINHVTHLFLHGLLHLFGYDHRSDYEAVPMERLETKIMAALGLPDPYGTTHAMEPKQRRAATKKTKKMTATKRRAAAHSKR